MKIGKNTHSFNPRTNIIFLRTFTNGADAGYKYYCDQNSELIIKNYLSWTDELKKTKEFGMFVRGYTDKIEKIWHKGFEQGYIAAMIKN